MKKFIILFAIFLISGCSYFKGMLKNDKKETPTVSADTQAVKPVAEVSVNSKDTLIKVMVSNLPLRAVGDSVRVNYRIIFPEGSVSPNEKLIIMPVITYTNKRITADSVTLQGEALNEDNIMIVPKIGTTYKGTCSFPFNNSDPKNVSFHIVLLRIEYTKTKFDNVEQDQKTDTIFTTKGLSLIDRLLVVDEFVMMANAKGLDSLAFNVKASQYAKKDSSQMRIDSIVSVLKTRYTSAVIENNLGVIAFQNNDMAMAKQKFQTASSYDSLLIEPKINMALIDIEQGNYEAARKNLNSGVLYHYINGHYTPIEEQLTGYNKALVQILLKRLNKAEETLEATKGNRSDMLKLLIYSHRGETEKVDSILYKSNSTFEGLKGYNIVKNEIELYK